MNRFRKRPVEIEAVQWQDCMTAEIRTWLGTSDWSHDFRSGALSLKTLEGVMRADVGDWIIRGVAGEFYPCKPHIFAATYEPVAVAEQEGNAQAMEPAEPMETQS